MKWPLPRSDWPLAKQATTARRTLGAFSQAEMDAIRDPDQDHIDQSLSRKHEGDYFIATTLEAAPTAIRRVSAKTPTG